MNRIQGLAEKPLCRRAHPASHSAGSPGYDRLNRQHGTSIGCVAKTGETDGTMRGRVCSLSSPCSSPAPTSGGIILPI